MKKQAKNSDFYERVYEVVTRIPEGKVTTYGAIARHLGTVSAARTVGYALNSYDSESLGYSIPAHRVVNRLGELTGRSHFEGDTMKERLEQEQIFFVEDYKIDIKRHFWDPDEI